MHNKSRSLSKKKKSLGQEIPITYPNIYNSKQWECYAIYPLGTRILLTMTELHSSLFFSFFFLSPTYSNILGFLIEKIYFIGYYTIFFVT